MGTGEIVIGPGHHVRPTVSVFEEKDSVVMALERPWRGLSEDDGSEKKVSKFVKEKFLRDQFLNRKSNCAGKRENF